MIAVSWSDYEKYGCVNCGCDYCYTLGMQGGGCSPVKCGECEASFIILADGLNQSRFGFGTPTIYPSLQEHPRYGILKHKYTRPDIRPETGGEYWNPRGVGYDLSGFVNCKDAGERIVQLVEKVISKKPKSWLDYREREPNWIQVKIQNEDGFDLQKLNNLCSDGTITEERLRLSLIQ